MLAGMVVKPQTAALHKGHIGQTVVFIYFHQTVLQILGVGKFPVVNDSGFLQQCAAGKAVKIGTCNQSHMYRSFLNSEKPTIRQFPS